MKLNLSINEIAVLDCLIEDGRMSNTDIARKIGITSQAVGKIQSKLIKNGIIKGFTTEIDYDTLGIEVFTIAFFRFKSGSWTYLEKEDIIRRLSGPHLIRVYRLSEDDITHIVIYGFRNIKEAEHYFQTLQVQREHISEIRKLYYLSSSSILKNSPQDLLLKILREGESIGLAEPEII
jgi:DNA-binding Lrp family transcriptional regulator